MLGLSVAQSVKSNIHTTAVIVVNFRVVQTLNLVIQLI